MDMAEVHVTAHQSLNVSITERMAAEISWSQENRELCSACMEEFESATEVYIARLTKFT